MGRCKRCHSQGKTVEQKYDFASYTERFPRDRFGNGINWELAEEKGLIDPVDFLEGISIKRKPLPAQKDFALSPKAAKHARHDLFA